MKFADVRTKEMLLEFLRYNEPRAALVEFCRWVLDQPEERFTLPRQGMPIKEMIHNWSIRFESMRKRGRAAAGLKELLERLHSRPPDERILVCEFDSEKFALSVICDSSGGYLGFNRMVPAGESPPDEFVRLERLATREGAI